MGARNTSGFTIIETMLFLGITGLLVIGVLVGAGTSLNNQRYRDAVETFKNTLQEQYSMLGSVRNERSNTWSCDSTAQPSAEGQEIRGQSNCVVVGQYLRIQEGDISAHAVLAHELVGTLPGDTDIQTMRQRYAYNVAPGEDKSTLEWGTKIAWPVSGVGSTNSGPRSIGILFIRSPSSGNVYTFSSDSVPASADLINSGTFTEMMVEAAAIPGRSERTLCIQSGGLFGGGDMAVTINRFASGTSAVETRSNSYMKANMGLDAPQC